MARLKPPARRLLRARRAHHQCAATAASDPSPGSGGSAFAHPPACSQADARSPVGRPARSPASPPSTAAQTARGRSAVRRARRRTPRCPRAAPPARRAPAPDSCTPRPSSAPVIVEPLGASSDAGVSTVANPKSSTFTVPSARTLMFAGFRSRWMMPCSCAASSASAICRAIGSASSTLGRAMPLRQVVALDQLHHERACAVARLRDRRSRRCADDSARPALRASRSKRASRSGSSPNAGGRTLIATSRPSRVSRAR